MRIFVAALVAVMMCCAGAASVQAEPDIFRGRSLADALRILQQGGLRIVFSSEIVKPDMRVSAEPRGRTPMQQLDELLAPHALKAERVGTVIQIVRDKAAGLPGSTMPPSESRTVRRQPVRRSVEEPDRAIDRYAETLIVTANGGSHADRGVSSEVLTADDLRSAGSALQADPLQAIRGLPGVTTLDDFRSDLSVRGSRYRDVGIVVDGVAAPWLQHAVFGRSDAGSLSIFGADNLKEATLQSGAYPHRYDDRLGAQLELTLREGSRESSRVHGWLGGTTAGVVAEGPLGNQQRGSWIVSVRNSSRTWPFRRQPANGVGFAFADTQAKLVYDVTSSQQISMTAVGGRSTLDTVDEPFADPLAAGTNLAALVSVGWRTTLGARSVIRQRVSVVGQDFVSRRITGESADRAGNRALSYRSEVLHAGLWGMLEAGGEIRSMHGTREMYEPLSPDAFAAAWSSRSIYGQYARHIGARVSLAVGVRASDSTLVHHGGVAPWILGEWSLTPDWTLRASTGASHQYPELEAVRGVAGTATLNPERATYVDVGIEHRLSRALRWQATLYERREKDVIDWQVLGRDQNSLAGASRGMELRLSRESAARVSGWIAYAYARTRQTDMVRHESFWADFDQPHALSAAGTYRLSDKTSVGVTFRSASSAPVPGYLTERSGSVFAGDRRNTVRLPYYARLDVRAQHTFDARRGHVTLFADALNVLNRNNVAPTNGVVQPITGVVADFSRALMPRRASVGIDIRFGDRSAPPPR